MGSSCQGWLCKKLHASSAKFDKRLLCAKRGDTANGAFSVDINTFKVLKLFCHLHINRSKNTSIKTLIVDGAIFVFMRNPSPRMSKRTLITSTPDSCALGRCGVVADINFPKQVASRCSLFNATLRTTSIHGSRSLKVKFESVKKKKIFQ